MNFYPFSSFPCALNTIIMNKKNLSIYQYYEGTNHIFMSSIHREY